jgi:hypothetical protein
MRVGAKSAKNGPEKGSPQVRVWFGAETWKSGERGYVEDNETFSRPERGPERLAFFFCPGLVDSAKYLRNAHKVSAH